MCGRDFGRAAAVVEPVGREAVGLVAGGRAVAVAVLVVAVRPLAVVAAAVLVEAIRPAAAVVADLRQSGRR